MSVWTDIRNAAEDRVIAAGKQELARYTDNNARTGSNSGAGLFESMQGALSDYEGRLVARIRAVPIVHSFEQQATQQKIAEITHNPKTWGIAALVVVVLVGIGYKLKG